MFVVQHVINGTMKTVFMSNLFHAVILLDFINTARKMKFSIKDFFSKCDQIRRNLQIWSHLLNKFLMENFSICAV